MAGGKYVTVDGATATLDASAIAGGDVVSLSLDLEAQSRDVSTWRTYPDSDVVVTSRKATGSITYKLQDDETMLEPGDTAKALVVTIAGKFNFEADIKITKVGVELNTEGEAEVKVDFTVSGAYTLGNGAGA